MIFFILYWNYIVFHEFPNSLMELNDLLDFHNSQIESFDFRDFHDSHLEF